MTKLSKTEADVARADDGLEPLRIEKENKETGARDPENVDWLRNIKLKDNNDSKTATTFSTDFCMKLNSISEAKWKEYTNGSFCKAKDCATAMSHLPTYYDQNFSLTEFGCLLGVKEGHHNVILAMKK